MRLPLNCKNLTSPSAIISFFLILSFAILSNDQWFIPIEVQSALAFNLFNQPANAVSFLFVHSGIAHLLANVLLVFFLGRVVEQFIERRFVLGLFFGVGILSFAVFNLISPKPFGIGASGGAIALTTSALLFSPKKSFIALAAVITISLLLIGGFNYFQTILDHELEEQKQAAQIELDKAIKTNNSPLIQAKTMELKTITKTITKKKEHKKYEKKIPIADTVHLISSVLTIGFLFLFCPVPIKKAMRQRVVSIRKIFGQKKTL